MRQLFTVLVVQLVLTFVVANQAAAGPLVEGSLESEAPLVAPNVDWDDVTLFGIVWQASCSQLMHADTLSVLGVGAFST